MEKTNVNMGIITRINDEKNFIIVDGKYLVDKSLCTEGKFKLGAVVEMIKRRNVIESFRIFSEEYRMGEDGKIEIVPQENLQMAMSNYWNSLPSITNNQITKKEPDVCKKYIGKDFFNNEIEERHIKAEYAFYIFYEQNAYEVFYSDKDTIQKGVIEFQKYPNQKHLKKVMEQYTENVPNDSSFRYTGGRWKDYYCEVEARGGWKTVYKTREVEKWVFDRSNMNFTSFQALLEKVKNEDYILMVEVQRGQEQWILQKFSDISFGETEYSEFLKRTPFTIYRDYYNDEKSLFQNVRKLADTMRGYPECITGVKLFVNGKGILIQRTGDEKVKEFCVKYSEIDFRNAVAMWERINSFYRKVGVAEITVEQFLEVMEDSIRQGHGARAFILEQINLVSEIFYTYLIQIVDFEVDNRAKRETLYVKYQVLNNIEGIEVGKSYNKIAGYFVRYSSKEYVKYRILEEMETAQGKKIVKAELADGLTYSLGQVLIYDAKKQDFLTAKRIEEMAKVYELEMQARYKKHWEQIIATIYDDNIIKLCNKLLKIVPKMIPDVIGYELEAEGEIVAEAEVCWLENKVVLLTPEQLEYRKTFEENGFRVFGDNENVEEVAQCLRSSK